MKASWKDYILAAFNAKPWGMFVAPNWVGLAAVGLLGLIGFNWGVWVLGLGLELLYLFLLSTNKRFQRTVDAQKLAASQQGWKGKLEDILAKLSPADRRSYQALAARCQSILGQQHATEQAALKAQTEGLGRLLWIYLRLLLTKRKIETVIEDSESSPGESLPELERRLELQMQSPKVTEDVRKSLSSQLEIVRQRLASQREAREKLAFLDAELNRVQQQVELIREQAVLTTDPDTVSHNIDQIAATLSGTTEWIQEQQKIYGKMEDLASEPPPIMMEVVEERR